MIVTVTIRDDFTERNKTLKEILSVVKCEPRFDVIFLSDYAEIPLCDALRPHNIV
jgi:hypothetical protein